MRILILCFVTLTTLGCAAGYTWTVQESNRPDGVYGDWVTEEVRDEFGAYTFSTAKGESSDNDFGETPPRIIIQDDFVLKMYVGDGYICDSGYIKADTIWYQGADAVMRENRYLTTPKLGNDHFKWKGRDTELQRLMHMLQVYDKLAVRYTDSCGAQRTITYAISGTHHNNTREIAPN